MENNDFQTNVVTHGKQVFSRGFKILLGFSIFLTILLSIIGVTYITTGLSEQIWNQTGLYEYVRQSFAYLCVICFCAFLISIVITQRPFSKGIVLCVRIIGCITLLAALVLPHLSGYPTHNFVILQIGSFVCLDGDAFSISMLVLIFAGILKEGFSMQNELDEVL